MGATVESVFIDGSNAMAYSNTTAANTRLIGCGVGGGTVVYNGVYMISPSSLRTNPVTKASGADVYGAFRNYAEFTRDATAQSVVAAWDQSIWTTDANGCPVFR